ncbi:MAG: hypothetical protein Q9O74_01860 [Planctomycetota bacterium]|nr:hypothetical protein [Planctomycetota bacterium]
MKLPGGDKAIVSDEKLLGYLLNPNHEHGASKAYLFKTLLGIERENAEVLRLALLDAARDRDTTRGQESPLWLQVRNPIPPERPQRRVYCTERLACARR